MKLTPPVFSEPVAGCVRAAGRGRRVSVRIGTPKAIASLAAFVAGPDGLVRVVRNSARSRLYSTTAESMPAAAIASLKVIARSCPLEIGGTARPDRCSWTRAERAPGTGPRQSGIWQFPLAPKRAMEISRRLKLEEGFLIPAIRPRRFRRHVPSADVNLL